MKLKEYPIEDLSYFKERFTGHLAQFPFLNIYDNSPVFEDFEDLEIEKAKGDLFEDSLENEYCFEHDINSFCWLDGEYLVSHNKLQEYEFNETDQREKLKFLLLMDVLFYLN